MGAQPGPPTPKTQASSAARPQVNIKLNSMPTQTARAATVPAPTVKPAGNMHKHFVPPVNAVNLFDLPVKPAVPLPKALVYIKGERESSAGPLASRPARPPRAAVI